MNGTEVIADSGPQAPPAADSSTQPIAMGDDFMPALFRLGRLYNKTGQYMEDCRIGKPSFIPYDRVKLGYKNIVIVRIIVEAFDSLVP